MVAHDFSASCQVRENGIFGRFQSCTLRVIREKKALQYVAQDGDASPVVLQLVGLCVKVHKGRVVSASHSSSGKSRRDQRGTTHFKFDREDALRRFMAEIKQWPEVFRSYQDYYDIGEKIGEGHTCKVYKCRSKLTGEICAIKLSTKTTQSHKEMHNELRILRYLNSEHPSLPRLVDFFYDSKGNIAIVLEYLCDSLADFISTGIPEEEAKKIFGDLLDGVHFMHKRGLAHRDLKVENLLFVPRDAGDVTMETLGSRNGIWAPFRGLLSMGKKGRKPRRSQSLAGLDSVRSIPHLKIIDFGFGKMRGGDVKGWNAFTPCGTTRYMAPEMVEGRSYSQAVDMWSCGCILHFMLFGKLPFSKSQVQEGKVSEVYLGSGREISPQAQDLLFALLSKKKEKRATAIEALGHPWFTDSALRRQRSKSEVLPLSKVSLSPGENLAKVLSKMREEEDREEDEKRRLEFGETAMKRPSPISVFDNKFESQASKEKTISILRLHLAEQLQVPAR